MLPKAKKIRAAFVVAQDHESGFFAATTRDKGSCKIGLPGGKVEPGESLAAAALREAAEEGWSLTLLSDQPIYHQIIKDDLEAEVYWLPGQIISPLLRYKEKQRGIKPVLVRAEELQGLGNPEALQSFFNFIKHRRTK